MPAITHDGRSFMIDGRRMWLVSGRIPYARVPRSQWADRILLAKHAGINTIETPVFWNRHETRPGRFDFTGENDLRHFVDLIGKAGLHCILSIGPSIGSEWDFGGLPAYLREKADGPRLRTNDPHFLESCSRYINAVAEQVRGWQITAPGTGGPIILLSVESEWTCGHEQLANSYLGELTRYVREAGLNVPLVNSNNLWQSVEGQIDGWAGSENLLATMRQLAAVRADQPRMVVDFETSKASVWGHELPSVMSPRELQVCLAQVLAGGGQTNFASFCGGTNFANFGGRTDDGPATYATAAADHGCAITQTGHTTELYHAARRLQMLASKFGRVFASLDPAYQPVLLAPSSSEQKGKKKTGKAAKVEASSSLAPSVLHVSGAQGGAVFLFTSEAMAGQTATLLLRTGTELHVPLGSLPVICCLLDVNVNPRCHLDYSNLSALGSVGSVLVVYGPAGAAAQLSVNDAPVEALVPEQTGSPTVITHENLTIVIVREDEVDHVHLTDDAVLVGVAGLTPAGAPIALPGGKHYTRIGQDGKPKQMNFDAQKNKPRSEKISLGTWQASVMSEHLLGESPRYANIAKLGGLAAMGVLQGYGWYRITLDNPKARSVLVDFGLGGDRLHVFLDGKFVGLAGRCAGAETQLTLNLKKGQQTMVVLAENLGRFASGANVGEPKGLVDEILEVAPVKLGKPELVKGQPVTLLTFRAPLWDVTEGDTTVSERLAWTFKSTSLKGKPKPRLMMRMTQPPSSGLVMLNEKPVSYVDRSGPTCVMLPEAGIGKGNNLLELTVVTAEQVRDELPVAGKGVALFEVLGNLAGDAELAFAKWEPPHATSFATSKSATGLPTWWRSTFECAKLDGSREQPGLMLRADGLTKGQLFVNGKHVCRYFVATKQGKSVPPQSEYFIPASFLQAEGANELMIFEEHGGSPSKVTLTRA
jgi:beta-galactosidase